RHCTRLGGLVQSCSWCARGSPDDDPSVLCWHTPPSCHTSPSHSSRQPDILIPDMTWLKEGTSPQTSSDRDSEQIGEDLGSFHFAEDKQQRIQFKALKDCRSHLGRHNFSRDGLLF